MLIVFIWLILPFSDEVPTVVLSKWSLHADYFDGDLLSGPVPLLFAENPEEAIANMLANKEKVNK